MNTYALCKLACLISLQILVTCNSIVEPDLLECLVLVVGTLETLQQLFRLLLFVVQPLLQLFQDLLMFSALLLQ